MTWHNRRPVAVWSLVFAVAVLCFLPACLLPGCGGGGDGGPALSQTAVSGATGQPTQSAAGGGLSAAEVAKHNSSSDCWLIIENKVYDVSKYLGSHPGGRAVIIPYCGKEATHAFEAINHSSVALSHLDSIYVGDLAP